MPAPTNLVFLQYLTTVFDNLDEAILLISVEHDGRYKLLVANETFARITGRTESPVNQYISEIVAPETWEKLKGQYQQVVTTKKPLEFVETYKVPKGIQTYKVKLIPILNAVGKVVQIAGITNNITELQNLREAVKQLREAHAK